jgi:hypothetical protein
MQGNAEERCGNAELCIRTSAAVICKESVCDNLDENIKLYFNQILIWRQNREGQVGRGL